MGKKKTAPKKSKIIFQGHLKDFNRRALKSLDNQIRLIIDCVGEDKEQIALMKQLADVKADEILLFEVTVMGYPEA